MPTMSMILCCSSEAVSTITILSSRILWNQEVLLSVWLDFALSSSGQEWDNKLS